MIHKILLIISFSMVISTVVFSQKKLERIEIVEVDSTIQPKLIIKWAMLSLIDLDNTLQFGLEYMLKGPWSIQQEFGYGNFNTNSTVISQTLRDKEVWRARTEIRLYLEKSNWKPAGSYLAGEFLYKKVNFFEENTIGRECENGDCAYFEWVSYSVMKNVLGYHLKLGTQVIVEDRLALDFYGGVGARYIFIKAPGVSTNNTEDYLNIYPTSPGKYTLLSGSLGFKMGYLIYNKNKKMASALH